MIRKNCTIEYNKIEVDNSHSSIENIDPKTELYMKSFFSFGKF